MNKLFILPAIVFLGLGMSAQGAAPATTLTITVSGMFGPNLNNGPDPVGGVGKSGTITIAASEALKPSATTARSATYTLPAGAVSAVIAGAHFRNTTPSKLRIFIPKSGPDTLVLNATLRIDHVNAKVVGVAQLAAGSFPRTVLRHMTAFTPASQTLTAAAADKGPGSKVSYSVLGELTVLGLSGTAANSAASN